jgi:signal transduction histidine kinase
MKPTRKAPGLHTRVIPAMRLAGLAVVAALIPLHNAAVFGDANWPAAWDFVLAATTYGLGSWLILKILLPRPKAAHWGNVFLITDVAVLILAIALTGGPRSWLFFLLAARCIDQVTQGFRRVVWFNHLLVGSYALLLAWIAMHHGQVTWPVEALKLAALYVFNWYCSLTARTITSIRMHGRRADLSKRASRELVGRVSHSLRTGVDGISTLLELLQKTSLNAKQREYAECLSNHNQNLDHLANLLNASGREIRRNTAQDHFSIRELLDETASVLRPAAEAKGIDLRVEIAEGTPHWVSGDRATIRQVLLSLAHNAVRFTEFGFVELQISPAGPELLAFQVNDTGRGCPEHIHMRLFGGFVRADGSEWRSYRGQYAGLAISKHLVELMGGTMELRTKPGAGTSIRFVLELPVWAVPGISQLAVQLSAPVDLREIAST